MTRSQKVVFVGLGVVLLLFVVVMGRGQMQPACDAKARDSDPRCQPGAGIKRLGKLLASSGSGVKLPQQSFTLGAGAQTSVSIPAASAAMRTLKLRLAEGGPVSLSLLNNDGGGDALKDQAQPNRLPLDGKPEPDRRETTFVVTKAGARLTIACQGLSRCTVAVE